MQLDSLKKHRKTTWIDTDGHTVGDFEGKGASNAVAPFPLNHVQLPPSRCYVLIFREILNFQVLGSDLSTDIARSSARFPSDDVPYTGHCEDFCCLRECDGV